MCKWVRSHNVFWHFQAGNSAIDNIQCTWKTKEKRSATTAFNSKRNETKTESYVSKNRRQWRQYFIYKLRDCIAITIFILNIFYAMCFQYFGVRAYSWHKKRAYVHLAIAGQLKQKPTFSNTNTNYRHTKHKKERPIKKEPNRNGRKKALLQKTTKNGYIILFSLSYPTKRSFLLFAGYTLSTYLIFLFITVLLSSKTKCLAQCTYNWHKKWL